MYTFADLMTVLFGRDDFQVPLEIPGEWEPVQTDFTEPQRGQSGLTPLLRVQRWRKEPPEVSRSAASLTV